MEHFLQHCAIRQRASRSTFRRFSGRHGRSLAGESSGNSESTRWQRLFEVFNKFTLV